MSPNPNTVSSAIIQDHNELKEYHQKFSSASTEDEKTRWANQFRWELARHSIAEELLIYPELERLFGSEGKGLADHDREEHQEAKNMLYELQQMKVTDAQFQPKFDTLMEALEEHMQHEEETDLVKLEAKLNPEESNQLLKSFQRTKKFVPTHSHPSAPDQPPFETVAGLLAAPIDKLKDMFSKFPKDA